MTELFCLLNNEKTIIHKNIEYFFYYNNNTFINESLKPFDHKSIIGYKYNNRKVMSKIGDITLLCCGEIYNYKTLAESLDIKLQYDNSNDIIIHLYQKYGITHTLNLLEGIFSFILYDFRIINNIINSDMYIARDEYGVKPLYKLEIKQSYLQSYIQNNNYKYYENIYCFSTNKHIISSIVKSNEDFIMTEFKPSTYYHLSMDMKVNAQWEIKNKDYYYKLPHNNLYDININLFDIEYNDKLLSLFKNSIQKRINYIKTNYTHKYVISCILTNDIYDIFLASFLSHHYNNIITYTICKNDKEVEYLNDISKIIKSYNIEVKDITDINDNKEEDIYNYLFLTEGKNEIFGLDIEYDNKNAIKYDMIVRNNIYSINDKLNKNSKKYNNINLVYPFLDKKFIDFYIGNQLIFKKYFKDNNIPDCFTFYLPEI